MLTLRECVEKLQLLKSPDERRRRLEEIPEIHADPNMDPNYESEEEDEADDKKQGYLRILMILVKFHAFSDFFFPFFCKCCLSYLLTSKSCIILGACR